MHKPGKVFCAMGRKHVYSVTSGEKGKTHTVVVCVSASGHVLPPMMINPRKKAVPESMQSGCVPITLDVIELACKNDIHLLCLPSHSSHILQPLDIGVFKSFKTHYPKACQKYIVNKPVESLHLKL